LVEVMVGAQQREQGGLIGFQRGVRAIIPAASEGELTAGDAELEWLVA
jgi:hypothetical protein